MENEKTNKALLTIYSYSDDEYDAGVDMDISSTHNIATLTTAIAELVLKSDTFAEIWHMANIAIEKLNAEIKKEDKIFN